MIPLIKLVYPMQALNANILPIMLSPLHYCQHWHWLSTMCFDIFVKIRYGVAAVVRPVIFSETVHTIRLSAEGIHPGCGIDDKPLSFHDDYILALCISDEFVYEHLAYRQCDCVVEPVHAEQKPVLRLGVLRCIAQERRLIFGAKEVDVMGRPPSLEVNGADSASDGNNRDMFTMVMNVVTNMVQSCNDCCTGQIIFAVSHGNASTIAFWCRHHLDTTNGTRYCLHSSTVLFTITPDELMYGSSGFYFIGFGVARTHV